MSTTVRRRPDPTHHHPVVHRGDHGTWSWRCRCGGASCRTGSAAVTWRQVVIQALVHSGNLAP